MTATSPNTDLIRVTRKGGWAGLTKDQRETFRGLGLVKNYQTVFLKDTNANRGMVNKVIHWVQVELVPASESGKVKASLQEKMSPGFKIQSKKG